MQETRHLMALSFETRRLDSELIGSAQLQPDHIFKIIVEADRYTEGTVKAEWGTIEIRTTLSKFRKLSNETRGKTKNEWKEYLNQNLEIGIAEKQVDGLDSTAWYLFKASILTYLWTEVAVLNGGQEFLQRHIADQFVLDFTGKEGPQRQIYFIPTRLLQEENKRLLEHLYALSLLSRLTTILDQQETKTYFVPLRVPNQGIFKFDDAKPEGGDCYRLWRTINACLAHRLQAFTEGIS